MTVTLSSLSIPPTIPTAIPSGLTLRNTYTTTQTGLSYPVTQVYIVLVLFDIDVAQFLILSYRQQ